MKKHAKLSASGSSIWLKCPGSIRLSEGIPSTTSKYAEEGTLAHDLAAKILLKESFNIEDFDPRMIDHVLTYTNYVESIPRDVILIEHKFDISHLYPDMFGTSDCTIYNKETSTLQVIDLKFGQGVFVDVVDNSQLMYYALGAYEEMPYHIENVTMTIVQPRFKSDELIRSHTIHAADLIDFSLDLVEGAKKTEDENAPLVRGFHCKFCPAKKVCPEFSKTSEEMAKSVFSALPIEEDPKELKGTMSLSEMLSLTRHGG